MVIIERHHITCLRCGMTSASPGDVEERYCGHCHDYIGEDCLVGPQPPAVLYEIALTYYRVTGAVFRSHSAWYTPEQILALTQTWAEAKINAEALSVKTR